MVYPAVTNVLEGIQYGDGGTEYTGVLVPMPPILIDLEGKVYKSLSQPLIMEI